MEKKLQAALIAVFLAIGITGIANADLFVESGDGGIVNVGDYDIFRASATQSEVSAFTTGNGNSPTAELAWINNVLNSYISEPFALDDFSKSDMDVEGYDGFSIVYEDDQLQNIKEPESYAYRLDDSVEFFLVKTGSNSFTEDRYFLFENSIASLDWGVFSLSSALQSAGLSLNSLGSDGGYTIDNLQKISHVDQIGGAPVPEPQTMLLFGTGLAGLAGLRLRRKK